MSRRHDESELSRALDDIRARARTAEVARFSCPEGSLLWTTDSRRIRMAWDSHGLRLDDAGEAALAIRCSDRAFCDLFAGRRDVLTLTNTEMLQLDATVARGIALAQLQEVVLALSAGWQLTDAGLSAIEATRGLELDATVARVRERELDFDSYAGAGRPVVIVGGCTHWPLAKLPLERLLEHAGDSEISLLRSEYDTDASATPRYERSKLRDYAGELLAGNAVETYLAANALPDALEPLVERPRWFPFHAFANTRFWLGPAGSGLRLHRDLVDNFIAQVMGSKELTLYAPDQASRLYPVRIGGNPFYQPSAVDTRAPDPQRHPRFGDARAVQVELAAGDLLYLPAGWWHEVRNLELALSINFFAVHQRPRAISAHAQE
jgi:hypothetical protein